MIVLAWFMAISNNNTLNTDPGGKPFSIGTLFHNVLPILTLIFLFLTNYIMNAIVFPKKSLLFKIVEILFVHVVS